MDKCASGVNEHKFLDAYFFIAFPHFILRHTGFNKAFGTFFMLLEAGLGSPRTETHVKVNVQTLVAGSSACVHRLFHKGNSSYKSPLGFQGLWKGIRFYQVKHLDCDFFLKRTFANAITTEGKWKNSVFNIFFTRSKIYDCVKGLLHLFPPFFYPICSRCLFHKYNLGFFSPLFLKKTLCSSYFCGQFIISDRLVSLLELIHPWTLHRSLLNIIFITFWILLLWVPLSAIPAVLSFFHLSSTRANGIGRSRRQVRLLSRWETPPRALEDWGAIKAEWWQKRTVALSLSHLFEWIIDGWLQPRSSLLSPRMSSS